MEQIPFNSEDRLGEIISRLASIETRLGALTGQKGHNTEESNMLLVVICVIVVSVFLIHHAYNAFESYIEYLRDLNGLYLDDESEHRYKQC